MIKALAARYPQREAIEDMSPWDKAYTREMRKIFAAFPDDLEVRAVFAESIMNETPWQMWDLPSGKPAEGAGTEECRALLEFALDRIPAAWDHPGLLHLYVHLMEMSPFPQRALRAGDRLREIVPDSGHLIHMPTHLDVLCGHYRDVLVYNQKAWKPTAGSSPIPMIRVSTSSTSFTTSTLRSTARCSSASIRPPSRRRRN